MKEEVKEGGRGNRKRIRFSVHPSSFSGASAVFLEKFEHVGMPELGGFV